MPRIIRNINSVAKYVGVAKNKRQHLQGLNAKGFRRPKLIVNGTLITAAEHGAGYGYSMLEGGGKPFYFWVGQPVEDLAASQYAAYIKTPKQKLEYVEDEDGDVVSPNLNRVLERGDTNADTYISGGEVIPYEKGAVILPSMRYSVVLARVFAGDDEALIRERVQNQLPAPWILPLSGQPKRGPDGMYLTGAVIIGRTLYGVSVDNRYIIWNVGSDEFREESIPIANEYMCCWRINQYGDTLIGTELNESPRRSSAELTTTNIDRYFTVSVSYNADQDEYSFGAVSQTNISGADLYAADFNYNAPRDSETGRVQNVPVVATRTEYAEQALLGDIPNYTGEEPGEPAPSMKNILVTFDIFNGGTRVGGYVAMRHDGGIPNGNFNDALPYYVVDYIAELRDLDLRYLMYSYAARNYEFFSGDYSQRTLITQEPETTLTGYFREEGGFAEPSDSPVAPMLSSSTRFRWYTVLFSRRGTICVNPDLNTQQFTGFAHPYFYGSGYNVDFITAEGGGLMPVNHEDVYNERPEDASYPEYTGPPITDTIFNTNLWTRNVNASNQLVDVAGFGGIDGYTPHDTITS